VPRQAASEHDLDMATELLLAQRMAERDDLGGAVPESSTLGQLAEWQEMMALLLCAYPEAPSPDQQTCTECDSDWVGGALPPEDYLG